MGVLRRMKSSRWGKLEQRLEVNLFALEAGRIWKGFAELTRTEHRYRLRKQDLGKAAKANTCLKLARS